MLSIEIIFVFFFFHLLIVSWVLCVYVCVFVGFCVCLFCPINLLSRSSTRLYCTQKKGLRKLSKNYLVFAFLFSFCYLLFVTFVLFFFLFVSFCLLLLFFFVTFRLFLFLFVTFLHNGTSPPRKGPPRFPVLLVM